MNIFEKIKIARLLIRIMTLQRKAPESIHYDFEYCGATNEIDFIKMRKVEDRYRMTKCFHCYLGKEYGLTLAEFEKQVAIEEEAYKNAKV